MATRRPPIHISRTGRQHGYGSMPYKWVSGLTKREIAMVDAGKIVLVTGSIPAWGGIIGPTVRQVIRRNGRLSPRVPSAAILSRLPKYMRGRTVGEKPLPQRLVRLGRR